MRHASAAYLASLSATNVLRGRIDAGLHPGDEYGGSRRESTMGRLPARVLDAAALPTDTGACKQKVFSGMVDAAVLQQLLREADDDPWFHAHVSLIALPGAGSWLTAPPAQDGREMDATLFRVAPQEAILAQARPGKHLRDFDRCARGCEPLQGQWHAARDAEQPAPKP